MFFTEFSRVAGKQTSHNQKIQRGCYINNCSLKSACCGKSEAAGRAIENNFPCKDYWSAGFDLSDKTLQLIKDGHIRCTVDQQPYIQGFYTVVQLTYCLRYGIMPSDMDAGAAIIDKSNVDKVAELTKQNYR